MLIALQGSSITDFKFWYLPFFNVEINILWSGGLVILEIKLLKKKCKKKIKREANHKLKTPGFTVVHPMWASQAYLSYYSLDLCNFVILLIQ